MKLEDMNYIYGSCYTNLDDFKMYEWPKVFVSVPRIGDRVASNCGRRMLYVVAIEHTTVTQEGKNYPYIRVELNRR